jgi:hypothetical protein
MASASLPGYAEPDLVDDFTKECLTITAAFGISGIQVASSR